MNWTRWAMCAALATGATACDGGGKVVEVKMITDEVGNRFEPVDVSVRRGDVIRYRLVTGVHNVSFPRDENPGGVELPPPLPMLQLPDDTRDVEIGMPAGRYTFQCDPHAVLGMKGTVTVTE